MKQVVIQKGKAIIKEVPAPNVSNRNILVSVENSCISVGTEIASVNSSGQPLYKRAIAQPKNVKRVLEMAQSDGFIKTYTRVKNKLLTGNPSGYSAAGKVIALGPSANGFSIGDKVACAGAGIANHAEFIDVPLNLAVKIPDKLPLNFASTVTLGAIAMQGVRRAQPTIGEVFVVVGLGIIGQLTAQILSANGCRVIGIDLDPSRINIALADGMEQGINPTVEDYINRVIRLTNGYGADGVIITAASSSHQIISDAMHASRRKGRVVIVGDVGLNLERSDFYAKELDLLISTSYGPGRYDHLYEELGQDYPLPYVRWTENRNMSTYLQLIASKKINLDSLLYSTFPIEQATEAYDALKSQEQKPLMVFLSYPGIIYDSVSKKIPISKRKALSRKIKVGLVGASSFAQGMHLPNISILNNDFDLHAVMSRTGHTALSVANQYKAIYSTTNYDELLEDDEIDLIFIATRHNLHCSMVLKALNAGKNVFVEKPLALNFDELRSIEDFYLNQTDGPLLMVGFNRRFSPAIKKIKNLLKDTTTPIIVDYRLNAGFLPSDHWVQGPEGGGRNIGEACHIYDVFNMLCDSNEIISFKSTSIKPSSKQWLTNDNFVTSIKYKNGSICTLTYTSMGHKSYSKEKMEIFFDEKVLVMDDYKSVSIFGKKVSGWQSKSPQKGQKEELEALAETLLRGASWPISLKDQIQATKLSLEIEEEINIKG